MKLSLILFLISAVALGADLSRDEERTMLTGLWKMPSELTEKRLERLLNQVSAQVYGKGFRYLGVDEDFFHGHLLVEKVGTGEDYVLRPRAILYHTQEEAYGAHWGQGVDPKYDYVDATARNWIQWLSDDPARDGTVVENARGYVDEKQKSAKIFEGSKPEPVSKEHYTIHARNLDGAKLGFEVFGELQWEFRDNCEPALSEYDPRRGPVYVQLPGRSKLCLMVSTTTGFIEESIWRKP